MKLWAFVFYRRRRIGTEGSLSGGLQRMKEQIGEKTIELNQNASSDKHPDGENHWGCR